MLRSAILAAAAASSASAWTPLSRNEAKSWDVKLYSNFKVINVTAGGSTYHYVLMKPGVTQPTVASLVGARVLPAGANPKFFTVPVDKASLLSTTQIQWAEVSPRHSPA